jgi:hypothetical protein
MPSLRLLGVAFAFMGIAIGALLPIFLVVYPAAGLSPQAAGDPAVLLPVVARAPLLFVGPGVLEMAAHTVGAFAVVGLWFRYGRDSVPLAAATLGGIAWMVIDVVDSAIAIQLAPRFASAYVAGDSAAASAFAVTDSLQTALRLAGHFGGGLWVLGISAGLLRGRQLNPAVAWSGIAVGGLLAANPLVPPLLNLSFITLPVWLVVFGVAVARRRESSGQIASDAASFAVAPLPSRPQP